MNNIAIFWLQLSASVTVSGIIAVWYVWPLLTRLFRENAMIALLWVHVLRYVGMTLLVVGQIDPALSAGFRANAAYGDLIEAALALTCIFALRSRLRIAIPLVWITNFWGLLDLLNGVRGVLLLSVPNYNLESLWYVYTFYVPVVLVSHLMIFAVLLKAKSWKPLTPGYQ